MQLKHSTDEMYEKVFRLCENTCRSPCQHPCTRPPACLNPYDDQESGRTRNERSVTASGQLIIILATLRCDERIMRMQKHTLRALVVDDETLGRERIRMLAGQRDDLVVTHEASDGPKAVSHLQDHPFDVVFLDIEMPELTGLDVVRQIGAEHMPPVIFCTAYDAYAIEAFTVHAVDYLLKPIDPDRFDQAVDRVVARGGSDSLRQINARLEALVTEEASREAPVQRFMIKETNQIVFVKADDVDWIEASGNYVVLHVGQKRHLIRQTMKDIEGRLDSRRFLRIHRSSIVNLDRVQKMHPTYNGEYEVRLETGARLTLSRSYRSALERFR